MPSGRASTRQLETQPDLQLNRAHATTGSLPVPEGLPLAHRLAFLQAVMARGWMPATEAKSLFAKLDKLSGGGSSYTHTIADINYELSFLLLSIRQMKYLVDGQTYIAFINKENDEIAKQNGSAFTIPQVQYLRGVIEAIATDPEAEQGMGTIDGNCILNIDCSEALTQATQATQSTKRLLSMNEKESALKRFVSDGWLSEAPGLEDHYTLGVRTFMELDKQLLEFDLPDETRRVWEQFL